MTEERTKAKSTAEGVAAVRAAGTYEKDPVLRNPDTMARQILGPKFKLFTGFPLLRKIMVRTVKKKLPGTYYFHIARTKHIDAALVEALDGGAQQVVILGAGFDTRAFRFRDRLAGITTFEVDYPGTQAVKQQRAARLVAQHPGAVRFVPVDFNVDSVGDELAKAGYDKAKKTFFIWEGVSMYITAEANDQVFAFVHDNAPAGSGMIFEYVFQSLVDGTSTHYGAVEGREYVAARGEPFIFGIPEGTVGDFVTRRGFELVSDLSGPELDRRYLADASGNVLGQVHAYASVATCRIA